MQTLQISVVKQPEDLDGAREIDDHGEDVEDGAEERMRGGIDDDVVPVGDPQDAQQWFHDHGLPNLLDDEEYEGVEEEEELDDGRWNQVRLDKPLYPGCKYSVREYAYALFKIKTGSIHDDRADQICKLIAEVMPEGFQGPKCVSCTWNAYAYMETASDRDRSLYALGQWPDFKMYSSVNFVAIASQ